MDPFKKLIEERRLEPLKIERVKSESTFNLHIKILKKQGIRFLFQIKQRIFLLIPLCLKSDAHFFF